MSEPKSTPEIGDWPTAITEDGTLLLGGTHVLQGVDPHSLLDVALKTGRIVFIAVKATEEEARAFRAHMNEAAHEAVSVTYRDRG